LIDGLTELVIGHPFKVLFVVLGFLYLIFHFIVAPWYYRSKIFEPKWVKLSTLPNEAVFIRKYETGTLKFWRKVGDDMQVQVDYDRNVSGKIHWKIDRHTLTEANPEELVALHCVV
jgi:hypothetical protein